jgi:hypothetical protein
MFLFLKNNNDFGFILRSIVKEEKFHFQIDLNT